MTYFIFFLAIVIAFTPWFAIAIMVLVGVRALLTFDNMMTEWEEFVPVSPSTS